MSVQSLMDESPMLESIVCETMLPSGKQPHNYGKITIFNGKTHYKWPFSIAMLLSLPEGKPYELFRFCSHFTLQFFLASFPCHQSGLGT